MRNGTLLGFNYWTLDKVVPCETVRVTDVSLRPQGRSANYYALKVSLQFDDIRHPTEV